MFNLGLIDELLADPAIWLCLNCGRCTDACSQMVDGREIICQLKDRAVQKGIVDRTFFVRLEQANRLAYTRWIEEVNALFDFDSGLIRTNAAGMNDFSIYCAEYSEAMSI